jgi:hypothetical protein
MTMLRRLIRAERASIGAEFALVLPIVLLFLLGIIDVGRFMWTWNRAEKATQMGVRYAAVTDMVDTGMASYDFYTSDGVARGDAIPDGSFGVATCNSSGCTCTTDPCPGLGTFSTAAFNDVVGRMQIFMGEIQPDNVTIEYRSSGLGYSGDPSGPDVNPLITITLSGVNFKPALGWLLGVSIALPSFASTLSMEDGSGTASN